eukprot:scaffold2586_cov256-Skeletonema_marinoi.AAC.9
MRCIGVALFDTDTADAHVYLFRHLSHPVKPKNVKPKPEAKTRNAYHGGLDFRYHWDNAFYASPYLMDENETEMGESQ